MVRSFDRLCIVDWDSIIAVVLIVFSLLNMYLDISSYFRSITIK